MEPRELFEWMEHHSQGLITHDELLMRVTLELMACEPDEWFNKCKQVECMENLNAQFRMTA